MALKVVNTESLDAVADAINAKAGTSGKLTFPDGFVEAVDNISAGIEPSGEINITDNGTHDVSAYATAKVQVGEAGPSVNGYDIATMQKFIDDRGGITRLYYGSSITGENGEFDWLSSIDLSKFNECYYLFYNAKELITAPLFDTSHMTNATYMFYTCPKLKSIPKYDFSKVTNCQYVFYNCGELLEVELDLSSTIDVYDMFYNCRKMTKCHLSNTGNITNAYGLFDGCWSLQDILPMDFSNSKNLYKAFSDCRALTTIKLTTAKNFHTSAEFLFNACMKLVDVPQVDVSKCSSVRSMFSNCNVLETIPEVDLRNATNTNSMFFSCYKLTNLTVKNIKANLQVGSGTTYGHLLTVDSLVGLCYELRDTGSLKTLTIGSANLEKLASVYVRLVEITDEMRAEDNLIGEKLPFERCESTDDGAMLISDYVLLKNWQLR